MDKKDFIIIALSVSLSVTATLLISGGVRRAGGVTPYIGAIMGSLGGE